MLSPPIVTVHQLKTPRYMSILITKNAACHLNLSDKIVILASLATKKSQATKMAAGLQIDALARLQFNSAFPQCSAYKKTKQQTALSSAFLVHHQIYILTCEEEAFPHQYMYSYGAALRMPVSTQHCSSRPVSLPLPSSQPSNRN